MNDNDAAVERLARDNFKREHPDRNWDLIATRRADGFSPDRHHAGAEERAEYRARARAELAEHRQPGT
jgi:hypothetical protein